VCNLVSPPQVLISPNDGADYPSYEDMDNVDFDNPDNIVLYDDGQVKDLDEFDKELIDDS